MPTVSRNAAIILFVVLLHMGLLWVLYSGLLVRVAEVIVPITVLSQLIEPPKPKVEVPPPRAAAPPPQAEVKKEVPKAPTALPPLPKAAVEPTPAPNAPTGAVTPQPAPAPVATSNTTPAPAAPPAPAALAAPPSTAVQQPSSDADYLQNPKPPYPPISRRLNEQGTSVVRVLVGTDGTPQSAEISKSSGFARLDSAAVATALRWRYVPGKRGGVAEAMSVNVPIVWVLD